MKNKFLTVLAVVFAMALNVYGASVTPEQAMAAAEAWSAENKGAFGVGGTAIKAIAEVDATGAVKWYAVQMSDGGCVFTTADSRIGPVIAAVADSDGTIPKGHPLRAMLDLDIKNRLSLVDTVGKSGVLKSYASSSLVGEDAKIQMEIDSCEERWGKYTQGEVGKMPVLKAFASTVDGNPPLILGYVRGFSNKLFTHWDQGNNAYSWENSSYVEYNPVYNYYTPYHWVCGCVATLGAAIVQTFNITNGPVAVTNQCFVNDMPTNLVTIGGLYDWSILPTSIGGSMKNLGTRIYTENQRELLGRVTYDMGVTVGMGYTQSESGATMVALQKALTNYWGFTSAEYVAGGIFGLPANMFEPLIYSQLKTGYPVGLGIVSGEGGHAVMAVGYGEDNGGVQYTRVFMGWGGTSDAWYQLPTIGAYSLIDAVVTMLSTDTNSVPVSGKVLLPNGKPASFAEVTIPSAPTGTVIRTGANGWFGVRIPKAVVTDEEVVATLNGMTGSVTYSVAEEILDPEGFASAIPAPLTITLSGEGDALKYYSSPDDACQEALETGKIIVVVSGDNGEEKTEFLKSYFSTNDVAAFNEKCVLYYAERDLDSYGWYDSTPSIGLFSPVMFSTEGLWLPDNGRFWYKGYANKEIDVDEIEEEIISAYENNVELEHWLAAKEDNFRLEVSGLTPVRTEYEIGYAQVFPGDPDVGFGVYENCYTNGEEVVIQGAQFMTNSVVWKCKGWYVFDEDYEPTEKEILNWLKSEDAQAPWLIASGTDTTIRINALSGANWKAYWMWEPVMYKVTANAVNGKIISFNGESGVTEGWFKAGEVVTICAAANTSSMNGGLYSFMSWSGSSDGGFYEDEKLGTTIKVLVTADRSLTAHFQLVGADFLDKFNVTVKSKTSLDLPAGSDPLPGTYVGGEVLTNDATVSSYAVDLSIVPVSTSYTDVTGGIWKCVGWVDGSGSVEASGTNAFISTKLSADTSVTWVWELTEPVEEFVIPEIVWEDTLDNLSTENAFLLAEASRIPSSFDINDIVPLSAPTGWVATPKIDPITGNLVAELSLNEEALMPQPVAGAASVITIIPNPDGTLTVKADVANGLRGFWYAIYGSSSVTGPWSLVKVFKAGGTSCEQANQTAEVGEINLSITLESLATQQFFKLVVLESSPE